MDLGLLRFATLSTGEEVCSPRPYKQLEKKLAFFQWRNRHQVIGSANWKKTQQKIAKLHYRISSIRSDFIHKLTTKLAKNHSQIVIEDLNISGLMKNGKLSNKSYSLNDLQAEYTLDKLSNHPSRTRNYANT